MGNFFNLRISFLFDGLSLFFLFVIFIIALPSLIYSFGYMKEKYARAHKVYGLFLFFAFIASMALVVTAGNAFMFLLSWEMMSLVSYFLVIFDFKQEKSVRAGSIYIVMTHIGTAFITAAFLIMYKYSGSFDFTALKEACMVMPQEVKNIVFSMFLVGFGTKAGIVPLHIWLPYAHPQAPSHISSLMSGVMIKTAVYGILRFIFCILGIQSARWGGAVLIIACVSCLVGVVYALMEHDLKKLLAYHSVENIGIILLGVGASMVFMKINMPLLAIFSLAAGLYHLINHAIFKGLLFLCAGSVYKATGTRNMEKLGGLIKAMPYTSFCFLIGAMAISALPPLNGFVSEWLILQAFFSGMLAGSAGIKIFFAFCAAALALTGGLAAACFVKAFGITFLGSPRSVNAQEAKEVSFSMKAAMIFLSALTVVFGLFAVKIFKVLAVISGGVLGIDAAGLNFGMSNFALTMPAVSRAYLSTPVIALALAVIAAAVFALFYLAIGPAKTRICNTWDCGYYKLTSRNEYTATAFSKPFRIAFSFFLQPRRNKERTMETAYYVKAFKYETSTTPFFKKYVYGPALEVILTIAKFMRRIQPGSIHFYLFYIFITILVLIVLMHRI